MDKLFITITIIGLVLLALVIAVDFQKDISEEKKTVYVKTKMGCVPLKDKYTDEEWKAKEEFYLSVYDYIPRRCVDGDY